MKEVINYMSIKKPINQGVTWTLKVERQLRSLVRGNTPTRIIALKLGRTSSAVQAKAHELNISLKPTNQSPYNRKK